MAAVVVLDAAGLLRLAAVNAAAGNQIMSLGKTLGAQSARSQRNIFSMSANAPLRALLIRARVDKPKLHVGESLQYARRAST